MTIKPARSAWIDGFTLGLAGRCNGFFATGERSLRDAVAGIGRITTPKTKKGNDGYEQLTLELLSEDDQPAGALRIELHARRQGPDLVFIDRCAISGNGMIMMRGVLGDAACGALSFDGKANVLGQQHTQLDPVERQLPVLVEAFEYAREALAAVFPGWSPDQLWLKRAEACRDLSINTAIAAARIIQHSTVHGAVRRQIDEYRRVSEVEERGIPTIRYLRHATGPEDKIYPKRDQDLRLEIACRDRVAVAHLTGAERADFTSDGVRKLFLNFVTAAAPRLDQLERHARETLRTEASIADVLVALKPLIDRAAGDGKAKGPTSDQAPAAAARVIDALLATGVCDGLGAHANHAIRRNLDALCENNGPLVRHRLRAIYYLKPCFAEACAAIRQSVRSSSKVQP